MADLWPGSLPQTFNAQGYSEKSQRNFVSTSPDAGPIIQRKRYTKAPRDVRGSMVVDQTQRGTLEQFYLDHQGVRFQWTDVRGVTRFYLFADAPSYATYLGTGIYYLATLRLLEFITEFGGG